MTNRELQSLINDQNIRVLKIEKSDHLEDYFRVQFKCLTLNLVLHLYKHHTTGESISLLKPIFNNHYKRHIL